MLPGEGDSGTLFTVRVRRMKDGFHEAMIYEGGEDSVMFARVESRDLYTTLEMLMPYMAAAAEPNILERAIARRDRH